MDQTGRAKPNTTTILVGLLSVGLGMVPVLVMLGLLPRGQAPSDPTPSWIGWAVGLAFISAGTLVVMRELSGLGNDSNGSIPAMAPWPLRVACNLLVGVILLALAGIFTWVAFGPGARHFSMSVGMFGMTSYGSGDLLGRAMFGLGALLGWCLVGFFARDVMRQWRR